MASSSSIGVVLRPVDPIESRIRWVGDVPAGFDEPDCIQEIVEYGHPRPEKFMVRESTGSRSGFYAMAYFATAGEAELFMAGGMTWSTGAEPHIKSTNHCVVLGI